MNITSDPADLGFDANRLARIDKHFAKYVDDGRLAGWQLAVTRRDELAHFASYGLRDKEAGLPVESDTIWRIASMTKPITSVAAMALWEEGVFQLTDPISKWIPSFADVRVYDKGSAEAPRTVPALEPIRVWHLLSHTSGVTAGFMYTSVVDALYRQAEADFGSRTDGSLEAAVEEWASLPLLFQPGTAWGYGMSTDVLGRLIEIWTGEKLDKAMANLVLDPLGMVDSVWYADESRVDRLAAVYARDPATGSAVRSDAVGAAALQPPAMFSGGGGLLGTTADYLRFTRMLERGGELDGARILAPRTVRLMASNHLDGDLASQSTGGFTEYVFDGVGFGLGFATSLEPSRQRNHSSAGEFYWGGAGSTVFWVDPVERVTAVFMTQLVPAGTHPINAEFRQLVYSALVD
ncbi:serine hydrolase domain-containing protein [Streptomyces sp. NPDC050549]|uniref:serine hydrolase domain-containing protein n=1 Tax=Streptomyces sp. NPDC050549 TaxID=3155406 RepID=UPI00342A2648